LVEFVDDLSLEGVASESLARAFEDGALSTRSGVTVLRSTVTDAAGLQRLICRVDELGLDLVGIRRVALVRSVPRTG
jgi:hypothetical protein